MNKEGAPRGALFLVNDFIFVLLNDFVPLPLLRVRRFMAKKVFFRVDSGFYFYIWVKQIKFQFPSWKLVNI